jgi:hypothetical protein
MKCVHCGKELTDDDLFCSQCGKRQKMVVTGGNIGSSAVCEQVTGVQDGSATQPHPEKDISKTVKPFIPVIPKRKLVNWKVFGCIVVVLAVIIGGIYAISEGDLFSESDSGSSRSRKDRDDRDDHDDHDDYYNYDDSYDYDDYYDDYVDYDPQPSYFDCAGCTNGWCNLCDGSGTYSNYGYSSDCACDDGICRQCDGEGIIYYD